MEPYTSERSVRGAPRGSPYEAGGSSSSGGGGRTETAAAGRERREEAADPPFAEPSSADYSAAVVTRSGCRFGEGGDSSDLATVCL